MNSKASNLRLQTLLSQSGLVSRRGAVGWIEEGRVSVNGVPATEAGQRVNRGDTILVDGQPLRQNLTKRYLLLHKPAGYLTSLSDPQGRPTVIDLIPQELQFGLYPVGRLDYFSEGLLILTNDGYWAQTFLRPKYEVEKEYEVTTTLPLPASQWRRFEEGLSFEGMVYRARSIQILQPTKTRIVLVEGKNREIRKAVQAIGGHVSRLVRVRIGNLSLRGLNPGGYRELSTQEVAFFRRPV